MPYQLGEEGINYMVVIEGIDPSSSAYETATHPSTSYHQDWAGGRELNPIYLFHRQVCAPVHYPLHKLPYRNILNNSPLLAQWIFAACQGYRMLTAIAFGRYGTRRKCFYMVGP